MSRSALESLFNPRSIAIVGASTREDSIGFRVIRNLRKFGFGGAIHPINPRYSEVAGLPCLPSVEALPPDVDAAFIAIPAENVSGVLDEVGRKGIRAAFANASGFADGGVAGRELQQKLADTAARHGIALCGPNNMGLVNVHDRAAVWTQLNMTKVTPGPVAVIAQSGSITLALAEDERHLGFSYLVTCGNEAVLGVGDYLDYIVRDDRVRTVLIFVESIRNAARFGAAADAARAAGKRVIALKTGTSQSGRSLVAAHTDSLAGDDAVYDAFFRRHGVIRVNDLDEMLETAVLVTAYPHPPANRHLVPVTLSGGEAALIADLSAQAGLELSGLSEGTVARLRPAFPDFARPQNPLDGWGLGFNAKNFGIIVDALQADPDVGAIALCVDAPGSGGGDVPYTLQMTKLVGKPEHSKPIIFFNNTSGTGPNEDVRQALVPFGIPYLSGMRNALVAMAHWIGPPPSANVAPAASAVVDAKGIETALSRGPMRQTALFRLLRDNGVPMASCEAVSSATDAAAKAATLGYPVVLKGCADEFAHKTELGLVRLGLRDADAVSVAYGEIDAALGASATREIVVQPMVGEGVELIVAARSEPSFGTVVVVGLGGIFVEFIKSVSVRLGQIDTAEARAMLDECRASEMLAGLRGKGPYDITAAAEAIAALSRFAVAAGPYVGSLEINPLIVGTKGAVGVDVLLTPPAPGHH